MTCPECYASDVATSEKEIRDEEACYREMVVVYACCECGCKSTEPSDWSDPDWDDAEVMIIADAVASLKPAKESEDLIEMLRRNPEIPAELVREMARAEKLNGAIHMNEFQRKSILAGCHGLKRLCSEIHILNEKWWVDLNTGRPITRNVGEMLALVHSEISEALEGHRKDLMDDHLPNRKMIEVELADAVIRICDMAAGLDLDLPGAIYDKCIYNANRADHKIENRLKEGGKRY